MGTAAQQQTPQIQPVQHPVTQPMQVQPVEQPVQTQNGRIVYNRQYGNIPKGSYTGGSTYTVKRGDTLFYIARITGNDFRDLAQRNNVRPRMVWRLGKRSVGNATGTPLTPGNTVSAADVTAQNNSVKPAQKSTTVVASQPVITYSEDSGDQTANKMLPNNKGTATTVTAPVTAPVVSSTEPTASSQNASSSITTALAN